MSVRYPNLLSPLQVGNVLLKNRMFATAGFPHMLQGTETYPTDRVITHMANRAKNGAAAVYLNFAFRTENGPGDPPHAHYVVMLMDAYLEQETSALTAGFRNISLLIRKVSPISMKKGKRSEFPVRW